MLPDGFGKALESGLDALVRKRFVLLDEHGGADHVGVEDYSELAR
jgi:hypothetical protein